MSAFQLLPDNGHFLTREPVQGNLPCPWRKGEQKMQSLNFERVARCLRNRPLNEVAARRSCTTTFQDCSYSLAFARLSGNIIFLKKVKIEPRLSQFAGKSSNQCSGNLDARNKSLSRVRWAKLAAAKFLGMSFCSKCAIRSEFVSSGEAVLASNPFGPDYAANVGCRTRVQCTTKVHAQILLASEQLQQGMHF